MSQSEQWPLISVRIPAYNHEQFIVEALDSVRQQSYPNKEIVIVDDGSTDATAKRIEDWIGQYGKKIPVTYRSRENRGVASTINELIELSKGEYLVGLASDDRLLPESLIVRYEYLQAHPEKMAVFGDSQVIDCDGRLLHRSGLADLHSANKAQYISDQGLKREIIQNWSVTGSVIMMRRALHEQIRYNEHLQVEDRDFYLKMVANNLLGFVNQPLSAYRVHGANTCLNNQTRRTVSLNKFRALAENVWMFSYRDRLFFIKPLLSSFFGLVIYSVIRSSK